MGWLKNIVKGSSRKIREGQHRHHDQTTWERSRNSDSSSDFDKEEIGRAIAVSIAEEEERRKKVTENEFHMDEDEQIAKALEEEYEQHDKGSQEDLNVDSPPQSPPNDYKRRCPGCNGEIDYESNLTSQESVWHRECFCCHSCKQPISSETESIMSGNHPYHVSCFKEQYHPKCVVCKNFIPTTNAAGRNEVDYRSHRYWSEKYCSSHSHDGTPRCCSCERMEPMDARYFTLEDGRELCLECLESSIMDNLDAEQLYVEIQEFYEGLNMKLGKSIPLLLVKREALNEAMEGEKGHHHMPEIRGLCLSEVQIVNAISRSTRTGSHDQIIDLFTEPYTLVGECEVTAILVLYGLPRLLMGSILAHEMMHAWLRLNGYPTLSPKVEEGICQVLAHMWLDSEILAGSATKMASASSSSLPSSTSNSMTKKGKPSELEKKLGKFFIHQIESDSSAAYGDGFKEGNEAVMKYGLKTTLDHILLTGCFP